MQEFGLFLRLQDINRPKCAQCDRRMWLTRFEPEGLDFYKRTFECSACERVTTEIIRNNEAPPASRCYF
jgi:hypothetical protein